MKFIIQMALFGMKNLVMTELEEYYQQTFQLTKQPETRGGIHEKTISIRVSGFKSF